MFFSCAEKPPVEKLGAVEPFFETSYKAYLDSRGYKPGVPVPAEFPAEIPAEIPVAVEDFSAWNGMNAFVRQAGGVFTGELGVIGWRFRVAVPGFYNLEVTYLPERGTNSQIKRAVYLDGEILHEGLRQTAFNRAYVDSAAGTSAAGTSAAGTSAGSGGIEVVNHNEIRPKAVEVFSERAVFIDDSQKRSPDPYLFYLSDGEHTLAFESVKEPMTITGLRFASAPAVPSYREYRQNNAGQRGQRGQRGEGGLVFQAERTAASVVTTAPAMSAATGAATGAAPALADVYPLAVRKSLPSITIKNVYVDPALTPYHPYRIVYNTIGGDTWRYPGDVIEWDIDVPEAGLYKLSFKGRQSANRGVISCRSLKINGKTPFKEAEALEFAYSASMKNYIPGGEEPYLFFFTQGKNTLSLEVVLGAFGAPYAEVTESVTRLNDLFRRVTQITGAVPDMFIDYEVSQKVPDFVESLEREFERLSRVVEQLNRITVEKGSNTSMIERFIEQIKRLSQRPDNITQELGLFKSNISALATWLITVSEMPLELDSFSLLAPDAQSPPARANVFRRAANDVVRFFSTFFVDSSSVDSAVNSAVNTAVFTVADKRGKKKAVKVWFPTGRDQAQTLRSLIDERFIPEYGVGVDLELTPIDVIMPATLAGVGPDVVLSMDQTKLMDFAVRNALVDVSGFEGFAEEKAKYYPSALEGITFQGKTYGLPETQSFLILFYRRDILDSLGLTPPKTWDELRELIPVFHMNNYDVYIPHPGPFGSLIIQKGGDFYRGAGNDYGIESGLLEESAMKSFKELTDFFTAYKLPVSMDFSNRFRTGEVPLGIADYTEYCRLELFAPEIRGLWSFAPLPGTVKEDGSIDNRVVTGTSQTVILKAAEKRGVVEACWAFARWWLSTDIQTEYANGIEAILGASARYATANRDVLTRLPWPAADAAKLLEQFASTKGIPPVPGSYMTDRMVGYAFNNVVAGGANARETLYLNTKDINAELSKKRKEFGLSFIDYGGP
jgi:ABC-type glycerol-3-phosphate transport system substrate-binding protein